MGGDAPGSARQPGVEDDTLADLETPGLGPQRHDFGHHLMAGDVGQGGEGGHGVVDVTGGEVAQDQLGLGSADPGQDRPGEHPVGPGERGVVDLVQAEGDGGQQGLELVGRCRTDFVVSGAAPKTRAFMPRPGLRPVGHGPHAQHEGVEVRRLHLDDRLHVGEVVLELLAVDGVDDAAAISDGGAFGPS